MGIERHLHKRTVAETVGFFFISLGLFVGLALCCHSLAMNQMAPLAVKNLTGPIGAGVALPMLKYIGLVSFVFPFASVVLGLFMVAGLTVWPKKERFIALFGLAFFLTGLVHVWDPFAGSFQLGNGIGGVLGRVLGEALVDTVGLGGAFIVLGFCLVVVTILTGKFVVTKTMQGVDYVRYLLRKRAKKAQPTTHEVLPDNNVVVAEVANGVKESVEAPTGSSELEMDFTSSVPANSKPSAGLFKKSKAPKDSGSNGEANAKRLTEELKQFKVEGQVQKITDGPVVTTYEFEPAAGMRVAKIVGLGEDLARLLKAQSLRVIAPIPGKDTVGFEIPNEKRRVISFGDLIGNTKARGKSPALPIYMGVDTFGDPVVSDLAEMPHLLIAGSTGSGKSVFLNTLIASLVCKKTAKELRLVMVDPKMVELTAYDKLPHMACGVVTDLNRHCLPVLDRLVAEMEERYQYFGAVGAKNLQAFNKIVRSERKTKFPDYEGKWQTMPSIVVVIEEFADFVLVLGKDAETAITRLAQKARAAGIHLVIATQRPSASVVTGLIKANFPTRVAFRVLSNVDSRTILDQGGAESLLGKGDMLYLSANGIERIHGAMLEEDEISKMIKACNLA